MTTRAVLFAGPSLAHSRSPLLRQVDRRAPARCGDLLRLRAERPAAVGLVDGVFEVGPSVWHKEILCLLEAGIPVFGAASLGALRAAELDRHGMIGVGDIYLAYAEGGNDRDDAVMVTHAPAELGFAPLTIALVDAEASIAAAALAPPLRAALVREARRLNFRDRTWPAIIAGYEERAGRIAARIASGILEKARYSQKQRDAEALLEMLLEPPPVLDRPVTPRTSYLKRLLRLTA